MFNTQRVKWLIGVVIGIVLVALLIPGCASAAPKGEEEKLRSDLQTAQADLTKAQGDLTKANTRIGELEKLVPPAPQYKWKFALYERADTASSLVAKMLADLISYYSKGRIGVELGYGGVLGPIKEAMEKTQRGDIALAYMSAYTDFNPDFDFLRAPFIATTRTQLNWLFAKSFGGIGGRLMDAMWEKIGAKPLMYWMTLLSFSTVKGPILTVSDLKGMKLRIVMTPVGKKTVENMGAIPASIAAGEVYTALQTKTIDGAIGEPVYTYSNRWHEVSKYISDINWYGTATTFAVNLKLFNSLDKELQEAVTKAGLDAEIYAMSFFEKEQEDAIVALKKDGATYTRLTSEQRATFYNAVKPAELWEEFVKPILKDKYEEWKADVLRVQKGF